MLLSDFDFDLPEDLIARFPLEQRSASRLLHLDRETGAIVHRGFADLCELLAPGDLLVFNDTRVIPARLYGRKATGGRVEILVARMTSENEAEALLRSSKPCREGALITLEPDHELEVEVMAREGEMATLRFPPPGVMSILGTLGHVPLPPYLEREDVELDRTRYQTVYARRDGAVAAPTAGLHFDEEMLALLADAGVESGFVTLHVGLGTFQPVRVEQIEEHRMHAEYVEVSRTLCDQVAGCRERGGRVVAVGTTSVRCLESASSSGTLSPCQGETDLFIYPGFEFRETDVLLTNFHLPRSSLIMLVSAFCGLPALKRAYREAVEKRYRFFSYGDAMLIT